MESFENIPYKRELESLFRQMPVMTGAQFARAISLLSGYEGNMLSNLLYQYERNGLVLVSENSFVATKFSIGNVCQYMPDIRQYGQTRMESFEPKPFFQECIDCFNMVLDLYPNSMDFRISRDLFQISFVHKRRSLLYELVRIPRNKDDLYRTMLLEDSKFYAGKNKKVLRENIRRIAMVESAACADTVPFTGINMICVIDPSSPKGFNVFGKRTPEDAWKDVETGDE